MSTGLAQAGSTEQGGSTGKFRSALTRSALRFQTDERLVELLRAGHERAFETIDERYRPQLVRYCTPMLGADRAQDVAQQTLTQAYLNLGKDDRPVKLRWWLLRVAHNFSVDALRKKSSKYEELDENFDGVAQPAAIIEQRSRLGDLVEQIDGLPERQRAALLLREFEGRSYDEIAAELGASTAVVSQLLQRARTRLRNSLGLLLPMPFLRGLISNGGSGGSGGSGRTLSEILVTSTNASPGAVQAGAAALATGVMTLGAGLAMVSNPDAVDTPQSAALTASASRNAAAGLIGGSSGDPGQVKYVRNDRGELVPVAVGGDGKAVAPGQHGVPGKAGVPVAEGGHVTGSSNHGTPGSALRSNGTAGDTNTNAQGRELTARQERREAHEHQQWNNRLEKTKEQYAHDEARRDKIDARNERRRQGNAEHDAQRKARDQQRQQARTEKQQNRESQRPTGPVSEKQAAKREQNAQQQAERQQQQQQKQAQRDQQRADRQAARQQEQAARREQQAQRQAEKEKRISEKIKATAPK
jgi:RNA polymerase sigma factor (sigma-70 family)